MKTMETIKMVKKDCGIHYGLTSGKCNKCPHFAQLEANPKFQKGLQTGGTPFNALLNPAFGSWKYKGVDGVKYQQNLRDEWDK